MESFIYFLEQITTFHIRISKSRCTILSYCLSCVLLDVRDVEQLIPGDLLSVTCNGVNASLRSNGNGGGRTGIEIDGKQDIRLLKPYKTRRRMKRLFVCIFYCHV